MHTADQGQNADYRLHTFKCISCYFRYRVLPGNRGFQARFSYPSSYLDSTIYPPEKCEK